jgi:transposase
MAGHGWASSETARSIFPERLGNPRRLRARYEAGPTGYELARLLGSLGVACQVIAPALVSTAPGDRVKTESAAASARAA